MIRSTLISLFVFAIPAVSWAASDYDAALGLGAAYLATT